MQIILLIKHFTISRIIYINNLLNDKNNLENELKDINIDEIEHKNKILKYIKNCKKLENKCIKLSKKNIKLINKENRKIKCLLNFEVNLKK